MDVDPTIDSRLCTNTAGAAGEDPAAPHGFAGEECTPRAEVPGDTATRCNFTIILRAVQVKWPRNGQGVGGQSGGHNHGPARFCAEEPWRLGPWPSVKWAGASVVVAGWTCASIIDVCEGSKHFEAPCDHLVQIHMHRALGAYHGNAIVVPSIR